MKSGKNLSIMDAIICQILHENPLSTFAFLKCTVEKYCDQWSNLLMPFSKSGLHRKLNSLENWEYITIYSHRMEGGITSQHIYSVTPLGDQLFRDLIRCCSQSEYSIKIHSTEELEVYSND